jgi:hypothetical protein
MLQTLFAAFALLATKAALAFSIHLSMQFAFNDSDDEQSLSTFAFVAFQCD